MIIHVLLCIAFWHCEAIAANSKTGEAPLPGAGFCKVGFRQSWPGESSSNSIKNIDTTHFWQEVPVINNYCACQGVIAVLGVTLRADSRTPLLQ